MTKEISRRTVLRGMLGGVAVSVGLPLFDCFLNGNGTALATGGALPVRFGTWFWGNGMNPPRWAPTKAGADYDLPPELLPLADVKDHVSIFSGYNVPLDGRANNPHDTALMGLRTGTVPDSPGEVPAPTFDILIARQIGTSTRFRSLEINCTGVPNQSYSRESQSIINASSVSPLELYARIFGPDFFDPNDGEFVPDPKTVLRKSVLSAVGDDAKRLEKKLGSHDRQRLDQYLTSLRQLENQIEVSLSPPNLEACRRPAAPRNEDIGTELGQAHMTHGMMTDLLVFALLCDQTRVFNMIFSWGLSALRKAGEDTEQHQLTHDEVVDPELGYQPRATEFVLESMNAWAFFVKKLASTPEGDGSLLDNCLVMAHSEHSFAKSHAIQGIPMMIAGTAGGRIRSGIHVPGVGEPATRVGLTVQQVMGLSVSEWGTRSMQATRPVSEILA